MHATNSRAPLHTAEVPPYTPLTLAHAERAAQGLHQHYRRRTLDECRLALARAYGHDDWAALGAAIAAGRSEGADDEMLDGATLAARRARQQAVVLELLGGVTAEDARAAQAIERALAAPGAHSIGHRYDPDYNRKRIARARYAYHVAYAREAIEAVRPSAREPRAVARDDDDVNLIHRVDLLPRALCAWLTHHRPLLVRWSAMIGGLRVRQRCPAELLDFSFAWGELCLLHGIDIPRGLQVYPIALCAQWYAWVSCLAAPELRTDIALLETGEPSEAQRERARAAVRAAIRERESAFLRAQPRDDFRALSPSAREQQMHAGHAAVRRYMAEAATAHSIQSILSRPTWLAPMPA